MTSHTHFTGWRGVPVNSDEPRPPRPRRKVAAAPICDICNRPPVWCDGTYSYCELHAPIPPTRAELVQIAAAPPWVTGGPVELPPCVVGEEVA